MIVPLDFTNLLDMDYLNHLDEDADPKHYEEYSLSSENISMMIGYKFGK